MGRPALSLHFHDLRRTGNTLAAPGARLADLKAQMDHDRARAAMIYQHATVNGTCAPAGDHGRGVLPHSTRALTPGFEPRLLRDRSLRVE